MRSHGSDRRGRLQQKGHNPHEITRAWLRLDDLKRRGELLQARCIRRATHLLQPVSRRFALNDVDRDLEVALHGIG